MLRDGAISTTSQWEKNFFFFFSLKCNNNFFLNGRPLTGKTPILQNFII